MDLAAPAPPALPATPRWLPLLWDWGPAAIGLLAGVLVAFAEGSDWLLAGVAAAALLGLRSRAPVSAWAGSLAVLAVAAAGSDSAASLALFLPTLPLAAVAGARPARQSLLAAAVTFAALSATLTSLIAPDPDVVTTAMAFGFCLGLAATGWLIGYALLTRRRYAAALEERARWLEERRHHDAARAALLERQALARELHDVVTHNVAVMTLQASAAGAVLETGAPPRAREAVAAVERTGRTAMGELRAMLGAMRGGDHRDGDGGMESQARLAQLEALVEPLRAAGLQVEVERAGALDALPTAVDLSAYRIVQEALTNALRHASATRVLVRAARVDGALEVAVADDGVGIPPSAAGGGAGGFGLAGMRERASLLGGTLDVDGAGGTTVRARLPL